MKIVRKVAAWVVEIVGVLGLHLVWYNMIRWLKGESKLAMSLVPTFASLQAAIDYIYARFEWRRDVLNVGPLAIPVDWVTLPEVLQYQLEQVDPGKPQPLEDCDGYHAWVARAMEKLAPGATDSELWKPYVLSVVWHNGGLKFGGHAVCVIQTSFGWEYINYTYHGRRGSPLNIVDAVVATHSPEGQVLFAVLQKSDGEIVEVLPV